MSRIAIVLGMVLCLMLLASACSQPAATPAAGTSQPPSQGSTQEGQLQKYVHIGVATAGTSQTLGTALANVLNKYGGTEASVEVAKGMAVYPLMKSGDIDVAPYGLGTPLQAYNGIGVEKTRLRDLTSAGAPSLTYVVLISRPDSGIKSIKDMKGKPVMAEVPMMPYYATMMDALFKVNGMTRSDITWVTLSNSTDGANAMIEKKILAEISVLGADTRSVQEAVGAYYIQLTPQEQAVINQIEPAFSAYTIPKGSFGGIPSDTATVASPQHYVARAEMNDITAYTIVKTLYEHIDEFHRVHAIAAGFKLENALSQMLLPIHPGAIKYYKEKGIWTAQHEAKQQELLAKEKQIFGN